MDLVGCAVERRGDDGRGPLGAVVEGGDAIDERDGQPVADRQVLGQWRAPGQLIGVEPAGQFGQRQWAAFGGIDAPLGNVAVSSRPQHRQRVVDREPLDLDRLEAGVFESRGQTTALGDDRHHRFVG